MYKLQSMKGKVAKTAVATVMTVALATMGLVGVAFAAPSDGTLDKGTDVLLKRTDIIDPDISVTAPLSITAALYAGTSENYFEILYADQAYIQNLTDSVADEAVALTGIKVNPVNDFKVVGKAPDTLADNNSLWTTIGGIGGFKSLDLGNPTDLAAPGWTFGDPGEEGDIAYLNFDGQAKTTKDLTTAVKAYDVVWTFGKIDTSI